MAKKKGKAKTRRVSRSYYYKQTGNEDGGNTGLIIGLIVVAVVGIGGYYLYKQGKLPFLQPKQPLPDGTKTGGGSPSSTPSNTSTPSTSGATPFKSRAEGNAFRGWVNDNYPDYARQIDLDRTGKYDNSFIRTAYAKYGAEYIGSGVASAGATATGGGEEKSIGGQVLQGVQNIFGLGAGATPFANKTQGDAFRGWVNDNHPTYAQSIDLDRSGAYDNSFIRKAFAKYGAEYIGSGAIDTNSPLAIQVEADRLYEAMKSRLGTDEDTIIDIAGKSNAMAIREYYDNNLGKYENRSLREWLMDELSEGGFFGGADKMPDGEFMETYTIRKFYG
jgi:hypothetical protein